MGTSPLSDSPNKSQIWRRFTGMEEFRSHFESSDACLLDALSFVARKGTIDCKELIEYQSTPLTSLGFHGKRLLNLNCIDQLDPELLSIMDCRFSEPIPFTGMKRLTRLHLTCVGKDELSQLENAHALRHVLLRLYRSSAHQTNGVLKSRSATDVAIHEGTFSDFSCFSLPGVTALHLHRCKNVVSLKGIDELRALREIELDFTVKTTDFDLLGDLPRLERILIGGRSKISSLSFISRLPNLTRIGFGTNVSVVDGDLHPLKDHPKLEGAYMRFKRHYYPPAKDIPCWEAS